jgi:small-conductance mechanosensitive channel
MHIHRMGEEAQSTMKIVTGYLPLLAALGILALSLGVGLLMRRLLLRPLMRLAKRTKTGADDILVESLSTPLPIWFLLLGVFIAARVVGIPAVAAPVLQRVVLAVLIGSITLWAANLVARLLYLGGHKATSATGVVRNLARIAIIVVGALVLFNTLGVSLAPLVTTVGLGGLAVALGLQNTVANLFAGMELTLEGNIRVGDFVKLESGEEGWVEDIHWRTTRVRTLFNQSILIPNGQLVDSVVSNYHLPTKSFVLLIPVGVHPESDLEHVERVALAVARTIEKTVEGGIPDAEPLVRFNAIAGATIDFNVILRVQEFRATFLIRHEFIKLLTRTFAEEGIVIPFPTQVIKVEPATVARQWTDPHSHSP